MRNGQKRNFARSLRRRMTDAEVRLWFHLRNRAFMGCKFRRQHPVGPYIADFTCIEARLIIELDGGQHAGSGRDASRTASLENEGYRVLRFWNNDVLTQTDAVLAAIVAELSARAALTPALSRKRERGLRG
ncbi:endonuclease domain-containing protein [Lysobacter niastensis]|uniref:Endonuclease domain-containing protein n=1 Tax=Lysobacter niastensis TaxID=380629 RepID=A0ABS0BA25_9GAMM|nr:endonuclease domain-containing protein [Lysobacter niastensis]MBF6025858.1 endonuclease domain-containing protein [Lysobacter niastensis]